MWCDQWCDTNSFIVRWSSEETIIPYICPTDNKLHRYFIDFKVTIKQPDGSTKTYLIEIKPLKYTNPPKFPGRRTQKYIAESYGFVKNQAKWSAAKNYAKDRGWEFELITEKEELLINYYINTNRPSRWSSIDAFMHRHSAYYWEKNKIVVH